MDITLEQLREAAPFAVHLDMEFLQASPAKVVGRLLLRPQVTNLSGAMHGGALMSLADNVGGACAFFNLPTNCGTATTDSHTRFLRPLTSGYATATATVLRVGRSAIIVETEIFDDEGRMVAKTTQSQAVLPR